MSFRGDRGRLLGKAREVLSFDLPFKNTGTQQPVFWFDLTMPSGVFDWLQDDGVQCDAHDDPQGTAARHA